MPRHILIANDSKDTRELLQELAVNPWKCRDIERYISMAETVHEAIGKLREDTKGLIRCGLIDFEMPLGNGTRIIEVWRELEIHDEKRLRASIALVTAAHGDKYERYKSEALRAGADSSICFSPQNAQRTTEVQAFLADVFRKCT